MNDFTIIFSTFTTLVASIPVVTQGIKKLINISLPSWLNQAISWIIGIILCLFGWIFDLGFLSDVSWWQAIIVGFMSSLAANGIFDIEFVKSLLDLIFGKIKGKISK